MIMIDLINGFNIYFWQVLLLCILSVGIYYTAKSRFAQIRFFPDAVRSFVNSFRGKNDIEGVSSYKALCSALAATVGTGNLAGVAGAIALGGPGAIFWMWVSGFMGMLIKFVEIIAAFQFRHKNTEGEWIGGPMQTIKRGLPSTYSILAYLYAFFGLFASFGIGNATQVNTIINCLNGVLFRHDLAKNLLFKLIFGLVLAVFLMHTFTGGMRRLGQCIQVFVPIAALSYIILASCVILLNLSELPGVTISIVNGAFHPQAVTGGVVGSAIQSMRIGISRGIFTNEAGMGTASIAHSTAENADMVQQGLLGIVEVFIDTIVICTLTAFAILCSGVPVSYGMDSGIQLTNLAFIQTFGDWIVVPLGFIACLLALATIMGWGMYGIKCAQFIFGSNIWVYYAYAQGFAAVIGSVLNTSVVWSIAEITNGFMVLPNLLVLLYISPQILQIIKAYRSA